jgi:hypothetical protein
MKEGFNNLIFTLLYLIRSLYKRLSIEHYPYAALSLNTSIKFAGLFGSIIYGSLILLGTLSVLNHSSTFMLELELDSLFHAFLLLPLCTISRQTITKLSLNTKLYRLITRGMLSGRSGTPKILNHLSYAPQIRTNSTQYLQNTSTTRLTSPHDQEIGHQVTSRSYPGKGYTAADHVKTIIGTKSDGKPLLESDVRSATGKKTLKHEESHTIIRDNETDVEIGVLSSCKKPEKGFQKVADTNYKEQTVGISNKDPTKTKPQFMKLFDIDRIHEKEALVKNEAATAFMKQHDSTIDAIVRNASVTKTEPKEAISKFKISRVHKDSSSLYHENGQPIFDTNGNEIDY